MSNTGAPARVTASIVKVTSAVSMSNPNLMPSLAAAIIARHPSMSSGSGSPTASSGRMAKPIDRKPWASALIDVGTGMTRVTSTPAFPASGGTAMSPPRALRRVIAVAAYLAFCAFLSAATCLRYLALGIDASAANGAVTS
jgi:hypothetical protein